MKYTNIISRLNSLEVYHMGGYNTLDEVRTSIQNVRIKGEVIDYKVINHNNNEIIVRYVIASYDSLINDIYIIDTKE